MATINAWKRVSNDYKSCADWSAAPLGKWPDGQLTFTVGTTVTAPDVPYADQGYSSYAPHGGIIVTGNTDDAPFDAALMVESRGMAGTFAGAGPARMVFCTFDDTSDLIEIVGRAPKWTLTYLVRSVYVDHELLQADASVRFFPNFNSLY
jgi:hypothetical protein